MAYPVLKMPIDGKWIGPAHWEAVSNPADGSIIAKLPHATRDNLDEALAAAECGFRTWRRFSQKCDTATGVRRRLPAHLHLPTKREVNDRLAVSIAAPGDRPARFDWALRSRARRASRS